MKSGQVIDILLADRWHEKDGFISLREFRPSMGWHGDRRFIDLWIIQLSPANGMQTNSVEVKVTRGDWLRELKQPLKRRPAEAVANLMWLAAPKGVAKAEELPRGWGLLEVDENESELTPWSRTKVIHPADYRDKVRPTWAFVASALANLNRRAE